MQQNDKHIFLDPALNADDAAHLLAPQEWINLQNFRIGTTPNVNGAAKGFLEAIGSTILIANPNLPAGTNYEIGSAYDEPNLRFVYFNWNSNGNHAIYCYDLRLATIFVVLTNSQLTGGLNFDKDQLIHSAFVLNGCVYWPNARQNQPRRLNIDAGIKLNQPSYVTTVAPYSAPLDISIISWIRRQPGLPPSFIKVYQTTPALANNFIAKQAFQYCYRYWYRDYEYGTLSALSSLCNYNAATDFYNRVDVSIALQELIQQDVIQIDLVAKYMATGLYFIINSWQTSNPTDAAAIAAHNAGTQALTYSFYNDRLGIALDSAYSVKPFDSVPIWAGPTEDAKNRSFLGNPTLGYDPPATTSLAAVPNTQTSGGSLVGIWYLFTYQSVCFGTTNTYSYYIMFIGNTPDPMAAGYYTWTGTVPPFPATVPWANVTLVGTGLFAIMNHFNPGCANTIISYVAQSATSTITGGPVPPTVIGVRVFKTDAPYQATITFYDYWGRKAGLITNDSLKVYIPDTTYSQLSFTAGINWTLSNLAALMEIPSWAYYFSVNISNCLRTRFFLQAQAKFVFYAALDANGNYTFTTTAYNSTLPGIAIDISALDSFGQGYTFAQGDICKLWMPSPGASPLSEYSLSIIGQVGQYIILQLANIGTTGGAVAYSSYPCLFEIYTPYNPQVNEPSYEVGQIFPINNPGTSSRAYSVIAGTLQGDVYILARNNGILQYGAENMNANDIFYLNWFTNAGRPNYVDSIGQTTQGGLICFSNTFINGAKINGLSTFDALDTYDLSAGYGVITKLILTNKIQRTGSVMLALGSAGETASLYLEENVITTTTGETSLAITMNVIGYVNNLRGSYGTNHPESVVWYKGDVYWWDDISEKYIQYSDSGLFPISNYKMTRFWKLFSEQFNSMTQAQIEALGSRPFVFSGIDPHNGELLISVPRVLTDPPNGYLTDFTPQIPYPFDIYDGQAKTIAFKIAADPNKWMGSFNLPAEGFAYMQDKSFAFYQGNLYQLNSTSSFCNLFGTQFQPAVMLVGNGVSLNQQTKPKKYNGVNVQANVAPVNTVLRTLYPNTQSSQILQSDYGNLEGVFYARIKRDRLTPGYPDVYTAQVGGNKLGATNLYAMFQFDATTGLVQVKFINILYTLSVGHAAV